MSVFMTFRVKGDPRKLEEYAAANEDAVRAISDAGIRHGIIAHRFYGTDDGQIMVIDQWPNRESFQAFFGEMGDRIRSMMAQVGVTAPPAVEFWRELDSRDKVGWGES